MAHGGCSIGFTGFTVKLNAGGNAGTRRQKDWPETTLCVSWEDSWVDDGSDLVEVMPLDLLIGVDPCEASKMSMQTLCQGWPCKEPSQKLWSKATWKLMTSRTVSWYCTSSPKLTHQLIISTYGTNSYFILWLKPRSRSTLPSQFCSFGQDERHEMEGLTRAGGTCNVVLIVRAFCQIEVGCMSDPPTCTFQECLRCVWFDQNAC